jgi:hypothetical protein
MLSKNRLTLLFLLFLFLLSYQFKAFSQSQKGMLMYKIENRQFKKTSYDKNKKLIDYQYIKVGQIVKNKGAYSLKIKVKSYSKNSTLKNEETSEYNCKTKEGNIFMGVFPFINKPSKKFDIKVLTENYLYPASLNGLNALDDYKLTVNYKTGVLGVSANVNMSYINRKIKKIDDNTHIITGEIVMEIFLAGINVSNIKYKSEEKIENTRGITYQKFVEDSGAYFTIQLVSK